MSDDYAKPLMSIEDVLALPPELRGKVYQAWSMLNYQIDAVKHSSLRLELGDMSSEQAAVLLNFAYAPLRHLIGLMTWSNEHPDLPQPRVWNFYEYYEALVKLSGLYKHNEKSELDIYGS